MTTRFYILIIALSPLFATSVYGCAISPVYQIAESPSSYAEKYNSIFLGRVTEVTRLSDSSERVELSVLELLKGDVGATVQVINHVTNSCSVFFGEVGSDYFVFGDVSDADDWIEMHGFPSFVPEQVAKESGMLEKLRIETTD